MKRALATFFAAGALAVLPPAGAQGIAVDLVNAAQREGVVESLAMPDDWANWKETWAELKQLYGLEHHDADMDSWQALEIYAQKERASIPSDIADIGQSYAQMARLQELTLPYKVSVWNSIPDWAKDRDGYWTLAYSGTIAFITDKTRVDQPPKRWQDLLRGDYTVTMGEVGASAQANNAVLAAAIALGGSEKDLSPALTFFGKLAEQQRLLLTNTSIDMLRKGKIDVAILWDFNALNYRDKIDRNRFEVCIPLDGSVISGYAPIINRLAAHPNAAKLTLEYIFSDEGQINLAKGFTRPIRSQVQLPPAVESRLLPIGQYANARPVQDLLAWEMTTRKLPAQWKAEVIYKMNKH